MFKEYILIFVWQIKHGIFFEGLVPRDDDDPVPYAAVSYIYNENMVTLSAMSESNHFRGRVVYTGNCSHW